MSGILTKLGIIKAETQHEKETSIRGVLEWNHESNPGMVYHSSADLPFFKLILVRPYESAIFIRDGKIYATLPEGRWMIDKMPIIGRMEIIWVDLGWQKIRFGLRTLTKDGVEIGANGIVFLKVSVPEKFLTNLVTSQKLFTSHELEDFLSEQISSILRAEMANYDVQSLYIEREMFASVGRVKLFETCENLGLEFQTLEVAGVLLPSDVKDALQAPMIAARQAQARVSMGTAEAEILKKIHEAGVDPIKLKGAEALMKYAERPGGPSAPLSGDFLMPLVFFSLLMKDGMIPIGIKQQLKSMFPQFSEEVKAKSNEQQSEPQEVNEAEKKYTKNQIQNILDGLDERLAKGEISEKTYNQLKEKWEKKL